MYVNIHYNTMMHAHVVNKVNFPMATLWSVMKQLMHAFSCALSSSNFNVLETFGVASTNCYAYIRCLENNKEILKCLRCSARSQIERGTKERLQILTMKRPSGHYLNRSF